MSVYSKLNSLLTAANNTTGESDTTLTDAVQTLIDGYGQGGGGVPIETGTFTVATKSKTYDIVHSLGVAPNFVFIYPLAVNDPSNTYIISSQLLVDECGQADWKSGTDTTAREAVHGVYCGVGYNTGIVAANRLDNLPKTVSNVTYSGLFTNEYVRVGGYDQTSGSGSLLGTYGYVVGVMQFVTAN